jgi:hypothetical protein
MRTKGLNGEQYFMLLIDDYTRMTAMSFLKNKSEAFKNFKIFKEMVENKMDSRIKCLISDNGGEFISKEFIELCEEHGIKRKFSAARTPQQNGVIERKNRIVTEMARTMLKDSKLSNIFWVQAVHTVIHILNRGMLISNNDKTPYELWKGRPTNVKHFRVFGSKCYIKREDDRVGKFDSRVDKGILVGLVCKGYAQVEGVYFEETFSLVARMEAIKLILAYACSKRIKVYQMDVKSTFLNGEL